MRTAFLFFFFAVACATTPVTQRKQLMLVSDQQMNELGAQAYKKILSEEKLSNNKELSEAVTKVGEDIAAVTGEKYPWAFSLFASDQKNAFCLPGGKVGVYTGILTVADTNAALAAVLSHEIAHATANHGAERMSQALLAQGLLGAANEVFRDAKYNSLIMAVLGLGAQFGVLMPYSRKHEAEADAIGMVYMAKAGYDPHAAIAVWEKMAKLEKGGPPEFLSTHPNSQTRVKNLRKALPKAEALFSQSPKHATRKLQGMDALAH